MCFKIKLKVTKSQSLKLYSEDKFFEKQWRVKLTPTAVLGLSNLKSKVDKFDNDKLSLVPVDLSNLSDAVKNNVAMVT